MWKKIRYVLYFTVLILIFSVTYNFREYYYVPLIQQVINKFDSKIKFRKFSIKLPFNLVLHDIEYDNKIFIDKAILGFEPDIFFHNIKSPLKSLSVLKINKIVCIDVNELKKLQTEQPKTKFQKFRITALKKFVSLFELDCYINKVNIFYKNKLVNLNNFNVVLSKGIEVGGEIFYSKLKIRTKGNIRLEGNFFTTNFYSEVEGIIKSKFDLLGAYNLKDDSFEYNVDAKELFINRLEFGNLNTTIKKDTTTFTVNSSGKTIKAFFKSNNLNFDVWNSTGTITLRDINDVLNAKLEYSAGVKDKLLDLNINSKDTKFFGNNLGDLNLKANNNNDVFNLSCHHNSGNSFETIVNKDGSYNTDVYNNKKKIGYLSGNYKKGEVSVDIKNIPIRKLPFIEKFKNVKGTVSLYGNIGVSSGTIYLSGKQIASKQLKNFDVLGKLYKKDYKWFIQTQTKDKKIVVNGFYEDKKNNNISVFYDNVDLNNVLKILGVKKPQLVGKIAGNVEYFSKDFTTCVNMKLKNGTLFDNKFDTWDISGKYSNKQINISTFSFQGPQANMQIKSFIDFVNKQSNSYFSASIKNFKIKGIELNNDFTINGTLTDNNEIAGKMSVNKFYIGKLNFAYDASMQLSKEKIKFYDFYNDNGLSGEIVYNFSDNTISSVIKNTNSKLSQFYPNIKGRLTSQTKISGTIKNPVISFYGRIKNGLYNDLLFNAESKITYKNKKMRLNKFLISDSHNKNVTVTGSGVLSKTDSNIQVKFKEISEQIINKYLGFRTPLKGIFYGDGNVTGEIDNLKYSLNIYADTMFVKSVKFNSFVSKLTAQNKIISIEDAKLKYSDSEMKIISANFDVNTMKYNCELKFVNTHLGIFDIFGNIKIDGKMVKRKQDYMYKGYINFVNLWLNEEKINALMLNYTLMDRIFSFETDKKDKLQFRGSLLFDKYPKIIFRDIFLEYERQSYKLHGFVFSDKIDINMAGKNLDLSFLTGLFNFPVSITGELDLNLKGSGHISDPNINLELISSNGSIYNVPFDLCDIAIDVKNNNLNINKFNIRKFGRYNFTIDGYFPFWLDPKLKNQMMNKEVNVNYKLTDNSLYILKNIAQNAISAKKGSLIIEGKLTGPRKNISNVGKFNMEGTNIKTDSFFNKIKDLDVVVDWDKNLFEIETAKAKIGSGILEAKGSVKMQGLNPSVFDLNLFTNKKGIPIVVKILPIPTSGVFKMESSNLANFSKATPVFDFKLKGTPKKLNLTGWAELENARFCYPSPVKSHGADIPDFISEMFKNLYLDIDLKSATSTYFENAFVNALLKGKINIKGFLDETNVNGSATSTEGLFSYIGTNFNIVNSKIEIVNNAVFVTAEGESEVYSAGDSTAEIIKVYVDRSNIDDIDNVNIKARFASKSDPTMSSEKALARLTKTDPTQINRLDTSTDFLVKQQAIRMFSFNIATPLANTVLKKTGIVDNVRLGFINQDTLQIDSKEQATMAELLYGMKYSVEKNINRLLQVGYSVTFDKVQREIDLKQALEMSFKLNRNLFLKGSYGLRSDDPSYEPEKRFMIEQRLRF